MRVLLMCPYYRHFLDIHASWIEESATKYCQIAMIHLDERHTADVIKGHLTKVIFEFTDIKNEQDICINTDSGANILKAVKKL